MLVDINKIRDAIKDGIPLVIKTYALPSATEAALEKLLRVFLEELGQSPLIELLSFGLRELVNNAKKANLRRAHFLERGLNIGNEADNKEGMATFVQDCTAFAKRYAEVLVANDLYLKVTFLVRNSTFYLSVRNNAVPTALELQDVRNRVSRAWTSGTIMKYFDASPSEPEAGLGLPTLVLLLRKLGLNQQAFDLGFVNNETVAVLRIPVSHSRPEIVDEIAEEISSVVQSIPPFPKNLQNLFQLIEDPEVEFSLLAAELAKDPALTADLIKYINSAQNRGHKRIENLEEAIRIVGTQGLKDLMYPYGAHKILGEYLAKQKQLWANATQVSRYAVDLARDLRFDRHEKGRTQIAGLLYNLGQIVMTFLYPEQSLNILEFCRKKKLSIELFDELTQSINPAALGALIAEKWRFPDDLVQLIRHQSRPSGAPGLLQGAASAVYLAASLRSVELGLLCYEQISEESIAPLGLALEKVHETHERLKSSNPEEGEQDKVLLSR